MEQTDMTGNAEKKTAEKKTIEDNGENRRLMSIREVSALTGVPPHTLRFWEKQMPDALRPERTHGGQRRYSPEMAERVRTIKRLSDEKRFSLAAIRDLLSVASGIAEPMGDPTHRIRAERAVDLIVDEVASLLKRKLLDLFDSGEPAKAGNPECSRADATSPGPPRALRR